MERDENTQPLVAADLFLGLAGVLLVVLALLPTGLRGLLDTPPNDATVAHLAASVPRPVAYAGATEARLFTPGGTSIVVPRDDLPGAPAVSDWLQSNPAAPLLILAHDSADTGFLLELALSVAPAITRVRLPHACGALSLRGDILVCGPP